MCGPAAVAALPYISAAFGALQTISQFSAARQEQKTAARNAQIQQEQVAEASRINQQALVNQQQEIEQAAANESTEISREAAVLRGRQRVASGEHGGGGGTQLQLLGDVDREAGVQFSALQQAAGNQLRQNSLALEGERTGAANQITNSRLSVPAKPSALAAGLQIGGGLFSSGVFDSFSDNLKIRGRTRNTGGGHLQRDGRMPF